MSSPFEQKISKDRLFDNDQADGYVSRQVNGWLKRYLKAKTDDIPSIEFVGQWLIDNMPAETKPTIIHNDYKYDNLVLHPSDPAIAVAVLDWEMCTIGCPLMDLGTTLAYWVDPDDPSPMHMMPFGPTALPGNLSRDGVVEAYAQLTAKDIGDPVFYYAYGLFKVAGIAQQIYARFANGLTQDPRFAMMIEAVKMVGQQAQQAIQNKRISQLYT